jgi:hypothetical protein
MALPVPLDDYALHVIYKYNLHDRNAPLDDPRTTMPTIVKVAPTEITGLDDLFTPTGAPTFARGFVTPPPLREMLEGLAARNGNRSSLFTRYSDLEDRYSYSCVQSPVVDANQRESNRPFLHVAFDEYVREGLLGAKASLQNLWHGMEGPQHKHTLTTKEALEEVLDSTGIATNLSTLGTFGVLTTFLANLEQDKMIAPMHCAGESDSLIIQLAGAKTWYFTTPQQLGTLPAIPCPVFLHLPMTDDELLERSGDTVYQITTMPGDVMVFGPGQCHAVITHAGPNVMFNIRYDAPEKLAAEADWYTDPLTWANVKLKYDIRTATRQKSWNAKTGGRTAMGPLYGSLGNGIYHDCGPSAKVRYMVEEATKTVELLGGVPKAADLSVSPPTEESHGAAGGCAEQNGVTYLWTSPRSLSTAFELAIRELEGVRVLHEPFAAAYYFGPEKVSSRYDAEFCATTGLDNYTFRGVADRVCGGDEPTQPRTFVKDMAFHLSGFMDSCAAGACDELATLVPASECPSHPEAPSATVMHTFLIRHPARTITSFYNGSSLVKQQTFDVSEIGMAPLHALWKLRKEAHTVVVDADRLLRDPEGVLTRYQELSQLQCPPKRGISSWSPISDEAWQSLAREEGWYPWPGWHDAALRSSGIIKSEQPLPDTSYLPEDVQTVLREAVLLYKEMLPYAI